MPPPPLLQTYESRGGATIGWVNYSSPLAVLTVDSAHLTITTTFFGLFRMGTYCFSPNQVSHIESLRWLPFFGRGIRIHHTVPELPQKVIFWCKPVPTINGILSSGFPIPQAGDGQNLKSTPRGFPFKILPTALVFLGWNSLIGYELFLNSWKLAFPGIYFLVALALMFCTTLAILLFPQVQTIFLKPGRSLGEVKPFLLLQTIISGILLLVFSLLYLSGSSRQNASPDKKPNMDATLPPAGESR